MYKKRKASLPTLESKRRRKDDNETDEVAILQIQREAVNSNLDIPIAKSILENLKIDLEPFAPSIIGHLSSRVEGKISTDHAQSIFHYVTRKFVHLIFKNSC